MTIASTTTKAGPSEGNDANRTFTFAFTIFSAADLEVVHTNASAVEAIITEGSGTTNYSVTVSSYPGSGSITYPATLGTALPTGQYITIRRKLTLTQGTDLQNQGGFFADTHETAFDKLAAGDIQQQEELDRSMKIPVSSVGSISVSMPKPVALKTIRWNSSANALEEADDPGAATTSATNSAATATAQAVISTNQATASAASAAAAAASYDSFDDRYLGPKSSDPSVDNDGAALVAGALYWNTSSNQMFAWTGSAWSALKPTSGEQTNIDAVAADASDIGAVAAKATEIGRLGTADAVADMAILGTTDVVADMNTLATSDVVADMNTLATSDVVADMNTLATSDVVADMNTLATSDVVADMNTLGTADVVTDMNTLGTADVVTDMNTLGTSANVTNMATVATNIAGVNSFAERYRVDSSDPSSSLNEGDLVYNTTANVLKYYNGSAWVAVSAPDVTLAQTKALAIALG